MRIPSCLIIALLLVLGACASSEKVVASPPDDVAFGRFADICDSSPSVTPTPVPAATATVAPELPPDVASIVVDQGEHQGPDGAIAGFTPPIPTPTPTPTVAPRLPFQVGDGSPAPLPDPQTLSVGDFLLDIDGAVTEGSGVVFLQDESPHLRLLAGSPDRHLQFDERLTSDGSMVTLGLWSAPSVIYGGDAVSAELTAVNSERAGELAFTESTVDNSTLISGAFRLFVAHEMGSSHCMNGVFKVVAADSGDWTCNWDAATVAECRFIDVSE